MLELTGGELFLVVFIAVALVSAPWWPRLGALGARLLTGRQDAAKSPREPGPESAGD